MTDQALTRVLEHLRKRPYRHRTDLYRWLRARHKALAAEFESSAPAWSVVAEAIATEGITGGTGKPPTGRAARRIWQTVCRDVLLSIDDRALVKPIRKPRPPRRSKWDGWVPSGLLDNPLDPPVTT